MLVLVGTNTSDAKHVSRGIYATRLDMNTGGFSPPILAAAIPNPVFLALVQTDHGQWRVYSTTESTALVAAFQVDPSSMSAPLIPIVSSAAVDAIQRFQPVHLAIDATGHIAAVAHYVHGFVASLPLGADGVVGVPVLHPQKGTLGPHSSRQDASHPHSVTFSNDYRFVYACDLGLDRIFIYSVDVDRGALSLCDSVPTVPGSGPRHSCVSRDGIFLYVINELNNTITVYEREPAKGLLREVQTISTLPNDFSGSSISAEIRVHPNGHFLYASNRGHDSLAVFARDSEQGTLRLIDHVHAGGAHPRGFTLTADGAWLICANRDSNNIVSFRVDDKSGRLTATGHSVVVPMAICVLPVTDPL
jgi:6-phosphogluconolactonase